MSFASAISRMRTGGSSGRCRASATIARQAYSAFAEIFIGSSRVERRILELAAVKRVKAAFGLRLAGPPARPLVLLPRDNGFRAGPTSDRGIALIVERIVRHLVRHDEGP